MHLNVFVRDASSVRLAGRVEQPRFGPAARFHYVESWLQASDAFSIDPWNLPLDGPVTGFRALRSISAAQADYHKVGTAILSVTDRMPSALEYAVASPDDRMGFLAFGTDCAPCQLVAAKPDGFEPFPPRVAPQSDAENGACFMRSGDEVWARLAEVTSPDTRIVRIPYGNIDWMLKLPRGAADASALVEAACLDMAEQCGVRVPQRMLVNIGACLPVLATERFDRRDGRPLGMVAARDIHAVDSSYPGLVRALDVVAGRDRRVEVFRRMAFNIAISNTDDHSGNHAFIRDVDGIWDLAPAFDLEPDLTSDCCHALTISKSVDGHGTDAIMAAAEEMGLSGSEALAELELVADVVSGWPSFLRNRGVEKRDISIFGQSFRPEDLLSRVGVAMPGWRAALAA